jgi:hypothetical protein
MTQQQQQQNSQQEPEERTVEVNGHQVVLIEQQRTDEKDRKVKVAYCRTCQVTARVWSLDLFNATAFEMSHK